MPSLVRNRRSITSRPQSNRPQTITGNQQLAKQLNAEEELERRHKQSEAKQRRIRRRLDELERLNYRDVVNSSSSSVPAALLGVNDDEDEAVATGAEAAVASVQGVTQAGTASSTSKAISQQRKRHQGDIKRLMVNKRSVQTMIQEASDQGKLSLRHATPDWASAASRLCADRAILTRKLCSICGYYGNVVCVRCGERYCGRNCGSTHDETRCERPLR